MHPNDTNLTNESIKDKVLFRELSYKLNGIFFKVHNELGRFRREFQYCSYFEKLLPEFNLKYIREHSLSSIDKAINRVDFIIEDAVLVDFKAKSIITKEDYYQMKRYLELSGKELGLIVNFR